MTLYITEGDRGYIIAFRLVSFHTTIFHPGTISPVSAAHIIELAGWQPWASYNLKKANHLLSPFMLVPRLRAFIMGVLLESRTGELDGLESRTWETRITRSNDVRGQGSQSERQETSMLKVKAIKKKARNERYEESECSERKARGPGCWDCKTEGLKCPESRTRMLVKYRRGQSV